MRALKCMILQSGYWINSLLAKNEKVLKILDNFTKIYVFDDVEYLEMLIQYDYDLNAKSENGWTALDYIFSKKSSYYL